ncbi:MAG: hypothetical protein DIU80_005150 [Chloroflexota bacterium]
MAGSDRSPVDDPGDAALRRVLADIGGMQAHEAPADLVIRASQRLPQMTPRRAFELERRRAFAWSILRSSSLVAVVALMGLSGWGALGGLELDMRPGVDASPVQAMFGSALAVLQPDELIVRATFGALVGFGLLLPCALLLGRWPRRTAVAGGTLTWRPGASLAIGIPLAAALVLLLPLAGQLAVTLVGLPLAALLAAVSLAPQLIGLAALARALGARLEGRAVPGPELEWPTAAVAAAIALLLALAAVLAPLVGLVLFALLAAPGLGAVVLSRVGTRLPESI